MFLIRDVFQAKPGEAKALVAKFKETAPIMKSEGFANIQIMTDFVANYWTVVLHLEVDNLENYLSKMRTFTSKPEVDRIMKGYMDLVQSGHREIYKIE